MPPEPARQITPPENLKRLRTYQSDVEEIIRRGQVSKASIAIAENEKQIEKEDAKVETKEAPPVKMPPPPKVFSISQGVPTVVPRRNKLPIILFAVVGLSSTGLVVGAFYFFNGITPTPTIPPQILVSPAGTITLQGGERRAGVINALRAGMRAISVPQNQIQTIPIKLDGNFITTALLFDTLETSAPPPLVRALASTPTLGLHGFQGGQPFLFFAVTSYDHAFAGMLEWEETLLDDIGPLFGISPRAILGKVGSTTSEALSNRIAFKDIIIRNKDARAAFDPNGKMLFLYAFIDKLTLVMTTNEDTLKFILSKAGEGKLK
ncbi:MAG: hypothetical protein Q7R64_03125 [bacterium]|nr:hypothetical protein [bacterium]